jgi:hypothetical protein
MLNSTESLDSSIAIADQNPDEEIMQEAIENSQKKSPETNPEKNKTWLPAPGEKVLFKDLDGTISGGWEVGFVNEKSVLLDKYGKHKDGDVKTKIASISDLREINDRGRVNFLQAENFPDLYELVKKNGEGLNPQEFNNLVAAARIDSTKLENISESIRPAVEKILAAEPKAAEEKPVVAVEKNIPEKIEAEKIVELRNKVQEKSAAENPVSVAVADKQEKTLDEKVLELKNQVQDKESVEKLAINYRTANPDNILMEKLAKMRHLNSAKVLEAPENIQAQKNIQEKQEKFDSAAAEKYIQEQYQKNQAEKKQREIDSAEAENKAQEKLRAEKEAAEKSVENKYQKQFGINTEDLKMVDGFEKLSRGQKLFVLENLSQIALAQIKDESREEYASGFKSLGGKDKKFLEKAGMLMENMWHGATKSVGTAKLEKIKANEVSKAGMNKYGELLRNLTNGMQDSPDVVEKNGRLEMQFLKIGGGSEVIGTIEKYNDVANEFMRLSKEWSYDEAKPGQKRIYESTKLRYETARAEALNAMKEKVGDAGACVNMNNAEAKVYLNQFLNQNPDVEEEIMRLGNQNEVWRAFKNFSKDKGLALASGAVIRSVATASVGMIAAPIAGGVIGGWQARKRAKEGLVEKDRDSRLGILDKSVEAKNFVAAEDLTVKLDKLLLELDKAEGDEKQTTRLAARINYTQAKIDKGLVVFGRNENSLTQQYELIQSLAQAKALWEIKRGEKSEEKVDMKKDLNLRLNQFLEFKKENISAKRAEFIKNKMIKGAIVGAGFATAGFALRHLAGEWFHWKTRPILSEGFKKLFSEAEAAELPPLATVGENEIRNVFLNQMHEFVPPAPAEQIPVAIHSGIEINPAGYQGGHSVWQEAEKQLSARFGEKFTGLGSKMKEIDVARLQNAIAAHPEAFGLRADIDINKVTAEDLKNLHWNEAVKEVFGGQKDLGEKIHNLHETLNQPEKYVKRFKPGMYDQKVASPIVKTPVPAVEAVKPAAVVEPEIKTAAEPLPPVVEAKISTPATPVETPSFHKPSLGYQNIPKAHHLETALNNSSPEDLPIHEAVLENPNIGPDFAAIQPEKIEGILADIKVAQHLVETSGNLDLRNVNSITPEVLGTLQDKTDGTIFLTGLDAEKITDQTAQALSELQSHNNLVLLDPVAMKIDAWKNLHLAANQQDWGVDANHEFTAKMPEAPVSEDVADADSENQPDWSVNSEHELTAKDWSVNSEHELKAEQPEAPAAAVEQATAVAETFKVPDGVPSAVFSEELRYNPFNPVHKVNLIFADKYSPDQQKNISLFVNSEIEERNELIKILGEYEKKYSKALALGDFRDVVNKKIMAENLEITKMINGAKDSSADLSKVYAQMTGSGAPRVSAEMLAEHLAEESKLFSKEEVVQNSFDQLDQARSAIYHEAVSPIDHLPAKPEISHAQVEIKHEGNATEIFTSADVKGLNGEDNLNMKVVNSLKLTPLQKESLLAESNSLTILASKLEEIGKINPHSPEAISILKAIKNTVEQIKNKYGNDKILSPEVSELADLEI